MSSAGVRCRRWWLVVLAGALIVRLAAFAVTEIRNPASIVAPDSSGYEGPARALLAEGRFSDTPGGSPHIRRTPVFPALIAAVYLVTGRDPDAVVLVGVVLSALTVAVAALVAARLGGTAAGVGAGILLVLDTSSVAACLRMLTEPPFTVLLTAAVASAVSCALGPRPRPALAAAFGALSAAAALTRPVGLFVVFPAAAWLLLCGRALHWRRPATLSMVAAFIVPWLVIVGGWQVRNRLAAGTYAPSGSPGRFLLLSRGGDIVSQRDGVPFDLARAGLMQEIATTAQRTGEPEDSLYLREGIAIVARHPMLFLRTQVRWLPELLLGTGAAPLLDSMGLEVPGGPGPARVATVIRAVSVLHLLVTYAVFAWAVFTAARGAGAGGGTEHRLAVVLLAGLVLYFVILSTGPQGYSRLRAPFMPLVAIGAGLGFADWRRRMQASGDAARGG